MGTRNEVALMGAGQLQGALNLTDPQFKFFLKNCVP